MKLRVGAERRGQKGQHAHAVERYCVRPRQQVPNLHVNCGTAVVGPNGTFGWRVPHAQVLELPFNDIAFVDECDDMHDGTAVCAFEGVDLVHLLNQPGPVGLASSVDR